MKKAGRKIKKDHSLDPPAKMDARKRSWLLTRGRILEAGLELFSRQGIGGTSIADIAQAAEVSTGAVFFHFESKEGLLREIIMRGLTDMQDRLRRLLEEGPKGVEESVRVHTQTVISRARENRSLMRLIFSPEVMGSKIGEDITGLLFREQEERLRQGMYDGYFRRDLEPRVAAWAVVGMLAMVVNCWTADPSQVSAEAVVDTLTKLRLFGLHSPMAREK